MNISCAVLVQRWSSGLSHTSKTNFTQYFLWPQNQSERLSIYQQIAGDIPKELFDRMCKQVWTKKFAFLNVDATQDELDGKYGLSFEKKFRVMRNDAEYYDERKPEEEQGRKAKKNRQLPWQTRHPVENNNRTSRWAQSLPGK